MRKKYEISFIIPALNEEEHIGGVINSIKRNMDDAFKYEIVVVDNGSSDRTIDIVKEGKIQVFSQPELSIGALRNFGASQTNYNIIVFLDADVYLRDNWGKRIKNVIEKINNKGDIITGSVCGLGDNASWLERYWWGPRLRRIKVPYINSGHMVLTRKVFESLGGFNEKLKSGEDPELCIRARKQGVEIINSPELEVIHAGYPKNIAEFYRRERWHGRGVFDSLHDVFHSKVTVLSLFQFILLIGCIFLALLTSHVWLLTIYFLFMILLCGSAAFHRGGSMGYGLFVCTFIFGVYFIARTHSFFDIILKKKEVTKD